MAKQEKILRANMIFMLIITWGIVSTTTVVIQYHRNVDLQHKLSQKSTLSMMMPRRDEEQKNKRRLKRKMKQTEARAVTPIKVRPSDHSSVTNRVIHNNIFPFTRSLRSYTGADTFMIHIVQSTTSDGDNQSSTLQWSEVRWRDVQTKWDRNTIFSDLIALSTPLYAEEISKAQNYSPPSKEKPKIVIHCLPKTASTTLRVACRQHLRQNCEFIGNMPLRQDPYGYRDVDKFFDAVGKCPDVHHYCVQGGDASMTILNYDGEKDGKVNSNWKYDNLIQNEDVESETYHFIHLVPFRNFDEWAASALKQIYVIDGQCDDIDNLLEQCLGYRELYMELYPKSVMALQIGMALNANKRGDMQNLHRHHIVLYDYSQTDAIMKDVSEYFHVPPMPKTDQEAKKIRAEGTCPEKTLMRFHECHDETLMKVDVIMDLDGERERRHNDAVSAKRIRPRKNRREKPSDGGVAGSN
mmetsp:Transcript_120/g.239  ORF Transcript_120/g.239 Transcript_120/m.239 type:complete len:467 (-) Transcript_120:54-1454(-)